MPKTQRAPRSFQAIDEDDRAKRNPAKPRPAFESGASATGQKTSRRGGGQRKANES